MYDDDSCNGQREDSSTRLQNKLCLLPDVAFANLERAYYLHPLFCCTNSSL